MTAFLLQSATPLIGGFHVVSGDTNNNGEMKNAGGQTKRAIHASGVLDFLLEKEMKKIGEGFKRNSK